MNKKKFVFIWIIVMISVIGIGGILLLIYSFRGWNDGITSKRQEVFKTNLGDKFIVEFEERNFPDIETDITLKDSKGKKEIAHFVIEGELNKTELKTILHTSQLRCYQFYNELIFKVDNNQFKGVNIEEITDMKTTEISEFIKVAKSLVVKKEWIWIQNCGRYLLKYGDDDMKDTIERYAKGEFTQEELDINQNSKITKEQMESFAKEILEQK